jgi:hypothetical protein
MGLPPVAMFLTEPAVVARALWVLADVLIEDDCESIGEAQALITPSLSSSDELHCATQPVDHLPNLESMP